MRLESIKVFDVNAEVTPFAGYRIRTSNKKENFQFVSLCSHLFGVSDSSRRIRCLSVEVRSSVFCPFDSFEYVQHFQRDVPFTLDIL